MTPRPLITYSYNAPNCYNAQWWIYRENYWLYFRTWLYACNLQSILWFIVNILSIIRIHCSLIALSINRTLTSFVISISPLSLQTLIIICSLILPIFILLFHLKICAVPAYCNPYGISHSWFANYYGESYSPFDIPFISITAANYI